MTAYDDYMRYAPHPPSQAAIERLLRGVEAPSQLDDARVLLEPRMTKETA